MQTNWLINITIKAYTPHRSKTTDSVAIYASSFFFLRGIYASSKGKNIMDVNNFINK